MLGRTLERAQKNGETPPLPDRKKSYQQLISSAKVLRLPT
jgi:hypothetical protein